MWLSCLCFVLLNVYHSKMLENSNKIIHQNGTSTERWGRKRDTTNCEWAQSTKHFELKSPNFEQLQQLNKEHVMETYRWTERKNKRERETQTKRKMRQKKRTKRDKLFNLIRFKLLILATLHYKLPGLNCNLQVKRALWVLVHFVIFPFNWLSPNFVSFSKCTNMAMADESNIELPFEIDRVRYGRT